MAVPPGAPPELVGYLAGLEGRLAALETPQGFQVGFFTTSANLTSASAAEFAGRWAFLSDLKTIAYADGVHWTRADTGAVIV